MSDIKDILNSHGDKYIKFYDMEKGEGMFYLKDNAIFTLSEIYDAIEEKILKSDKVYQSFKERYDREGGKLTDNIKYGPLPDIKADKNFPVYGERVSRNDPS